MSEKKTTQEILDRLHGVASDGLELASMYVALAELINKNQNVEACMRDSNLDFEEALEIGMVRLLALLYRETMHVANEAAGAASDLEFATREERKGK